LWNLFPEFQITETHSEKKYCKVLKSNGFLDALYYYGSFRVSLSCDGNYEGKWSYLRVQILSQLPKYSETEKANHQAKIVLKKENWPNIVGRP